MSLAAILPGLFGLVDKLFTTDEERANARLKIMELQSKGELAQLAVNEKEAEHASLFVAGWRPFIGWVCGFAFVWAFIVQPILVFVAFIGGRTFGIDFDMQLLPELDLENMLAVLFGMLGLGAMRSYERKHGVARDNLPTTNSVEPKVNRAARR